jgi:CheY-like chemotaxis protein
MPTILVVEDTAEIREIFRRLLTSAGFHVLQAGDGADGLKQARQHQPDLIVMDITLPVLDGISAVRELKADQATAHMPVIFVSGDAFAARRARAAGGEAFLSKPVRAAELLSTITRTLGDVKQRAGRASPRKAIDTAADTSRLKV